MDEENTLQEMTFTDQNDAVRVKYVFQAASADSTNPDAPIYRAEVFTALVALK